MPTQRARKIAFLEDGGLLFSEAKEFASNYSMYQLKTLPYFINLLRSRRLNKSRFLKQGAKVADYRQAIKRQYQRKGWHDVWDMLRYYRKKSIEVGDYTPPPRKKGTHHKLGISKGDLDRQKARARFKDKTGNKPSGRITTALNKIAKINAQLKTETNEDKRTELVEERNNLWGRIA